MGFFDRFKSRRPEDIRLAGQKIGFQYQEHGDKGLVRQLSDFKLFKIGGRKRAKNLLTKNDLSEDLKINLFDYHYTVSTGQSSHTYRQTVLFLQSKNLGLPQFYLKPEHLFNRIGAWFGIKDINFDYDPEFSRLYYLKGPDEELIRQTFSDQVLQFFRKEKNLNVEGLNYFLIMYTHKKLLSPDQIKAFFTRGMEMYRILKREGYRV